MSMPQLLLRCQAFLKNKPGMADQRARASHGGLRARALESKPKVNLLKKALITPAVLAVLAANAHAQSACTTTTGSLTYVDLSGATVNLAGLHTIASSQSGTCTYSGAAPLAVVNAGPLNTSSAVTTVEAITVNQAITVVNTAANLQGTGTTATTPSAILNDQTITNLTVNANLSVSGNELFNSGQALSAALKNTGTITNLTNNATMTSTANPAVFNNYGAIGTLTNNGLMKNEYLTGSYNRWSHGAAIVNNNSTLELLVNNGTIDGTGNTSIINQGDSRFSSRITKIYNAGTIIGMLQNNGNGFTNPQTTIGEITNSGTMYGVGSTPWAINSYNKATITTVNNLQGPGNSLGKYALNYRGILPANYNIIVHNSTTYGSLDFTYSNPGRSNANLAGAMAFNIYGYSGQTLTTGVAASTLTAMTYKKVLSNIFTAQADANSYYATSASDIITYPIAPVTLTNTSGIYTNINPGTSGVFSWNLVKDSATPGYWDLVVICQAACPNASSLNTSTSPTLAGHTLVLDAAITQAVAVTADTTISSSSTTGVAIANTISGAGKLTFSGTGKTVLSALNTYTGGTTVSSGTLELLGGTTGTGAIEVAQGAQLMGSGSIAGDVSVAGTLKPGNSPGYLSTQQNVTLSSGAVHQEDIAGVTQASSTSPVGATGYYAFLNVGGQYIINSGVTLSPQLQNLFQTTETGYGSAPYEPKLGDKFRIVSASGGISGRFASVTQPAGLASGTQLLAFYNPNASNSIDLATVPLSYANTLASNTLNAQATAGVLDQLVSGTQAATASTAQEALLYAAAGQSAASLPGFAAALAGGVHAASVSALPQAALRLQQSVLARLSQQPAPVTGAGNSAEEGQPWAAINYQHTGRSTSASGSGFRSRLSQLTLGTQVFADAPSELKVGAGLALSNARLSARDGSGSSTTDQSAVFVYGKLPVFGAYVLDGMTSLGWSSASLARSDVTGLSSGFANQRVSGRDELVSLGLSRAFDYQQLQLSPFVRVNYQHVSQSAYSEGSSGAALDVGRFNASAVRRTLGLALNSRERDPLAQSVTYQASLGLGADSKALLNPSLNTTLAGYASSVTTPTAGTSFAEAALHGTIKIAARTYAFAGLTAEVRRGQQRYGADLGLKMAF